MTYNQGAPAFAFVVIGSMGIAFTFCFPLVALYLWSKRMQARVRSFRIRYGFIEDEGGGAQRRINVTPAGGPLDPPTMEQRLEIKSAA